MLIRGGAYQLKETVVFSLEDSAPARRHNHVCGLRQRDAGVYVGRQIVGWTKPVHPSPLLPEIARDAVWTAEVPTSLSNVLTLYDGNNRLRRAWSKPFAPVAFRTRRPRGTKSHFLRGHEELARPSANGELRVIPSCDYEMCLLSLAEVDEKAGLAKTAAPASRTMGRVKFMDETAWVENILEVLDEPGEWVFSAADRKLYLWPTRGDPSDAIHAPRLTELLRIEGAIDHAGACRRAGDGPRIPRVDFHRRRTPALARGHERRAPAQVGAL